MCHILSIESLILYLLVQNEGQELTISKIEEVKDILERNGFIINFSDDSLYEAARNFDELFRYAGSKIVTTKAGKAFFKKLKGKYILNNTIEDKIDGFTHKVAFAG